MSRLIFAALLLALAGCQRLPSSTGVVRGEPARSTLAPDGLLDAEFSPSDPAKTLHWVFRLQRTIEEAASRRGNERAVDAARKEVDAAFAGVAGKKVAWPFAISHVGGEQGREINFASISFPPEQNLAEPTLTDPIKLADWHPTYYLELSPLPLASHPNPITLRNGQVVNLSGEVAKVHWRFAGRTIKGKIHMDYYFRVELRPDTASVAD